jgi:tetratricopeptide (TPR) repeat protein
MRKRAVWLLALALAIALTLVGYSLFDAYRLRVEVGRAKQDISRGAFGPAHQRLSVLARLRPGALGGEIDYWLGVCESSTGRHKAAVTAFDRVPPTFPRDPRGAYLESQAYLARGRLRAAESRLERIVAGAVGSDLDPLRALLVRIYQIQSRSVDAARTTEERIGNAQDPRATLKQLWSVEREILPRDTLRSTLDEAEQLAPSDDRVWLARARLALADGAWSDAETWLRRCLKSHADPPVWRAWLDWARGAERPEEVLRAARSLPPGELSPAEVHAIRAWFFREYDDQRSERSELEKLVEIEPTDTPSLERLAALATIAGDPAHAEQYRRRKADVDRALAAYRGFLLGDAQPTGPNAFLHGGRLAEACGRLVDAEAWFAAAKDSSEAASARERIEDLRKRSAEAATAGDPWSEIARLAEVHRNSSRPTALGRVSFTDDAASAGLRFSYENGATLIHQLPEPLGGGVAILDYDGDGWMDVYVVQGGPFPPSPRRLGTGDRLFRNQGDGKFTDVTQLAGLTDPARGYGHGVTVGDFDNDGWPDLFITRWRSYELFHNQGDGTFASVTEAVGLSGARGWPTSAAFADLDGDGDLDLYVCHYAVWDAEHPRLCRSDDTGAYVSCNPTEVDAEPDRLFRNDDGHFVDVSAEAGINERTGRGLGVLSADLDDDGRIDLFVANDLSANFLWHNRGGLKFEEVAQVAGVAGNAVGGYQAGMGVACGDLDGDGLLDLAVTNFYGESTTLYHNLGGGLFSDETRAVGLYEASRYLLGFGAVFFDCNNDGWLDLATANGHVNDFRPHFPYQMPAQLLVGRGDGRLIDVSKQAGAPWSVLRMGRGLAAGDLDNDGRLDLVLVSHKQPMAYFHNRSEGGHSLTLRLVGRESSRDAIGATIKIVHGKIRRVLARTGGGSYQSASEPRNHVGLGCDTSVESIEVKWPSGATNSYRGLAADRHYTLREGHNVAEVLASFAAGETNAAKTETRPMVSRAVLPAVRSGGDASTRRAEALISRGPEIQANPPPVAP